MGGDPKPTVDHEFIVNRNPDMATAWTKHRAIVNYESFHSINVDLKSDHIITPIETITNSALGIDGSALHDVGLMEDLAEAGGSAPISSLLHSTECYPSGQTSLTTSIVGGGGLGSSGASHTQGHGSQSTTGTSQHQEHGGAPIHPSP